MRVVEIDRTLTATGLPERSTPDASDVLDRGTAVGRYLLLGRLGVGGMGVVYAAHDPELDRKVALKLVLPEAAGAADQAPARLLREAQALAKLAHPNVVAIHDVGTFREQVWIAMEFVAGQTLGAWSAGRPRTWQESLRVLAEAARGVAAAHAAGLVHRDLKPDNVMIGEDGRVRVMDFGLAYGRAAAAVEPRLHDPSRDRAPASEASSALVMRLTRVGAVQGTPAYMAPEQWRGEEAEAAVDQFVWSVMAWEILYGERPHPGGSVAALADAVLSGRRRPPPRGARVPGWLRRILERGLAADPSRRWPTMAALLAAVERGQARARRRSAALALAGVAALGAASAGYRRWDLQQRELACEAQGAAVDDVWDDAARTRLRDAFVATGVSHAPETLDRVLPLLAERAAAWRQERTEACLHAAVRGRWGDELAARADGCLTDQLEVLSTLVDELGRATPTTVEKAVAAAAGLKLADVCLDEEHLRRQPAPPPEVRDTLHELRAALARVRSLRSAGNFKAALEQVKQTRERVEWAPLAAAARAEEALLLADTGAYAEAEAVGVDAYFTAARAGAWDVAANAANNLVSTVGVRRARPEDGRAWARHAEMAIVHAGDPMLLLEAARLNGLAGVEMSAGASLQAQVLFERALALWESALGPEHLQVAGCLNNLATVKRSLGAYSEAKALQERALALHERVLGPQHHEVAANLTNLAALYNATGELARARALYERVLAIRERVLGPDHPDTAQTVNNLAEALQDEGRYAEALALAERGLRIREKSLGPDHPTVAASLSRLAFIHQAMGDLERARGFFERALRLREATLAPEHPNLVSTLNNLGELRLAMGARAEGRALLERALAIRERTLPPDHPHLAFTRSKVGAMHLDEGRPRDALPLLERAVATLTAQAGVQDGEAAARFALARALVATDGDRGRARAEASAAREALRAAGAGAARELAAVEAWLAEHEPPGHASPPGL